MSQNTNFPALPPEQLAHLLTNEAVMNAAPYGCGKHQGRSPVDE